MSTAPRHNLTHSGLWTWTWGSALLLSALLVSPVGADTLLHLLRWHGTQAAVLTERELPSVPRRKAEDEPAPSPVQVATDDDTSALPEVLPVAIDALPVQSTAPVVYMGATPTAAAAFPHPSAPARPSARADAPPRAPPV